MYSFKAQKTTTGKHSQRCPNQVVLNLSSMKKNPEQESTKHAEIDLDLIVACHYSIKVVDIYQTSLPDIPWMGKSCQT